MSRSVKSIVLAHVPCNSLWKVLAANVAMNAADCIAACHVFEYSWGRYSLWLLCILWIDFSIVAEKRLLLWTAAAQLLMT